MGNLLLHDPRNPNIRAAADAILWPQNARTAMEVFFTDQNAAHEFFERLATVIEDANLGLLEYRLAGKPFVWLEAVYGLHRATLMDQQDREIAEAAACLDVSEAVVKYSLEMMEHLAVRNIIC